MENQFKKFLEGIKNSTKGINKNCPKCGFEDNRANGQSLGFDKETNSMVDNYWYDCLRCGESYEVKSEPLTHMKKVAEWADKNSSLF